jgi:hypothetical protein
MDGPFAETKEAIGYCRMIHGCPASGSEKDRHPSKTEAVGFSRRPGDVVALVSAKAKRRKAS